MPATDPIASGRIARIVLCNLDSVVSRGAVRALFEALPGRIGLVVASRRFGGTRGGFWRQSRRQLRHSGLAFANYLGLSVAWFRVPAAVMRAACPSLRQMAARNGAAYIETSDINAPATVARLRAFAPDLVLSLHFDQVMRAPVIAVPARAVINVHPSLLPALRGPCPAFWTQRLGARPGVSVHFVDSEALDAGPVLLQRALDAVPGESVVALDARLLRAGAALALDAIAALEAGDVQATAQAPGTGSYRSFPASAEVAAFRAQRGRLYRWRDVLRLLRGG